MPSLRPSSSPSIRLAKSKKCPEAGFPNGLEIALNGPRGASRDKEVLEAPASWTGGHQDHDAHLRVCQLPEQHGVRPQAGPGGWSAGGRDDGREGIYCRSSAREPPVITKTEMDGMIDRLDHDGREAAAGQYHRSNRCGSRTAAYRSYQQIDLDGASKAAQLEARRLIRPTTCRSIKVRAPTWDLSLLAALLVTAFRRGWPSAGKVVVAQGVDPTTSTR